MIQGECFSYGPLLWKSKVSKELCDYVLSCDRHGDARSYLAGKIRHEYYFSKEQSEKIFWELADYVKSYVVQCAHFHMNDIEDFVVDEEMLFRTCHPVFSKPWINYQNAGEYNPPHTHGADLSYVFYPKIPNEIYKEENITTSGNPGSIVFEYGEVSTYIEKNEDKTENIKKLLQPKTTQNFEPETGTIFMFPSYLRHYVYAFYNASVQRVSVSGNVYLEQEGKKQSTVEIVNVMK